MRVTIRDVAEKAGVSAMAVSAVLNGAGRNVSVSPETATRIRQAAEELRYRPNHLARSFRNQKTGQVAVVFQHFAGLNPARPYRIQLLSGVMRALFESDYTLSLCPKLMREGDPGFISDGRFDGVLWCRPDLTETSAEGLSQAMVPLVVMHAPSGSVPGVPCFCADNERAMQLVVDHLRDLGHMHLTFVIDSVSIRSVEGQARWHALEAAAKRCGLPTPTLSIHEDSDEWLRQFTGPTARFTALVCFSDDLAANILETARTLDISIPDEFSVVGFDSSPFCDHLQPRLTSINQPVERMAFEAATHLLSLIKEQDSGMPRSPVASATYECGLDVRESTAPPPRRAHP